MSRMRRIVLARPLAAAPVAADFRLEETTLPEPSEGELLARTLYLSLDPYVGSVLRGRHLGDHQPQPGDLVPGRGIGEVIASRATGFEAGDIVRGEFGWRDHAILPAAAAQKITPEDAPLSAQLGVAGMPGLTAYAGIKHLAKVSGGEHVLVSSAAGAVGGAAGQIARILGAARVVGIAGSPSKCAVVTGDYGFDTCVNYRNAGWKDALKDALPRGADVYFDNVGGELLMTALLNLANYGRVVFCGLASQYHTDERPAGPNPGLYIAKRAQLYGLVVYDFEHEQVAFTRLAGGWIREGRLAVTEDRVEGLENAPGLFEKLMRGENVGKAIVRVGDKA
ncbi:MAG: zinc-binding dehydrogenase [Parvularculaceae bacterium]